MFLVVIAGASVLEVRRGARSGDEVGDAIRPRVPFLLAVTLTVVGLSAAAVVAFEDEARAGLAGALEVVAAVDVALGAAVGVGIAAVYFGGLDRAVVYAQERVGDYVPAGSTAVLGTGGAAFVVANVVLAPLVEEVWYRGLLFDALGAGPVAAVVGCAAFGLFHWPGGAWYVVATAVLVGLPCWWLRETTGGLAAPYAAHLVLNVLEVVILTRRARSAG